MTTQSTTPAQATATPEGDALRAALAFIRWHCFGECRTEGFDKPIPRPDEIAAILERSLAAPRQEAAPINPAATDSKLTGQEAAPRGDGEARVGPRGWGQPIPYPSAATDPFNAVMAAPPAAQASDTQHPFAALGDLMRADPDYAWSVHCNVAMPIMDRLKCSHAEANEAGADVVNHLFNVDPRKNPNWHIATPPHDTGTERGEAVESIAQSLHALGHDAVAWDVSWNELFEAEREGLRGSARYLLKHHAFTHKGMQAAERGEAVEISPEFTDTSRAALAWVLYHYQGGSSAVGQAIRFALGMGQHERMSEYMIAQAKRWAAMTGSTSVDFTHKGMQASEGVDSARLDWLEAHRAALTPEFEGPWDVEVFGEDASPSLVASGKTLRDAIDAARNAPQGGMR